MKYLKFVVIDDGDWVHRTCPAPPRKWPDTCGACFLQHPPGACDRD